ncbi:DUF1287 domain-containing protein [Shigella flexneri]
MAVKAPDSNINHRRVPNMKHVTRHDDPPSARRPPVTIKRAMCVSWQLDNELAPSGVVSDGFAQHRHS